MSILCGRICEAWKHRLLGDRALFARSPHVSPYWAHVISNFQVPPIYEEGSRFAYKLSPTIGQYSMEVLSLLQDTSYPCVIWNGGFILRMGYKLRPESTGGVGFLAYKLRSLIVP